LDADLDRVTATVEPPPQLAGPPSGHLVVRHPLRLKSSYMEVARAEPAFTSIHSGFMGTVDFIWYTADPILQQQHQQTQQDQQQQMKAEAEAEAGSEPAEAEAAPSPSPSEGGNPPVAPLSGQSSASGSAVAPVVVSCGCRGTAENVPAQELRQKQPQSCLQSLYGSCSAAAATASTNSADANSTAVHAPASASASEVAGVPGCRFQLVPVAVLLPPDLELLPRGLPAAGWGSDHISIMTEFELRPM
ncbi:hypothetical protein Vafri_14764, partial [Volvox africanus]